MIRNGPEEFAQRLYGRVPAHYRVYDAERGYPMLALLRTVGEQASNLRLDLDDLWDNFFIETCDDWVVPYIGALVGTKLPAHPVGQSHRLEVWKTLDWRRSKGSAMMFASLAQSVTGWPADVAESFEGLGWSQNMRRLRPHAPLMPDLRKWHELSHLGGSADRTAHAADFRPGQALGQRAPHQIKSLGIFVRRLQTFAVKGATPAAAAPGTAAPNETYFSFDPLFRDRQLYEDKSQRTITRAALAAAPFAAPGQDAVVRQFGIPLTGIEPPQPVFSSSRTKFTFGGSAAITLDARIGIELLTPRLFESGGTQFIISAAWKQDRAAITLGSLSTAPGLPGAGHAFQPGTSAQGAGQLTATIQVDRGGAGRFPGAVIAVRAVNAGPVRASDALLVYLPPVFISGAQEATYFVADDGSTYSDDGPLAGHIARPSEGQIFPPRAALRGTAPVGAFTTLSRGAAGLRLADASRFGGASVLIRADLFTGAFQPLGAVATVDQVAKSYPDLDAPDPWPAFTYAPSRAAMADDVPSDGLLSLLITPLSGNFVPAAELIVTNRPGKSLLVYLPEITGARAEGVRLFVAADGSTYYAPASQTAQLQMLRIRSLGGLETARAASGQILPIPGTWPIQHRRMVAMNLCRSERSSLLAPGELGIDPERGRFAFAAGDPAIGAGGLTVDYVEAFSDRVGAFNYDRTPGFNVAPKRLVARLSDADTLSAAPGATIHNDVEAAIAAAEDGDTIEIRDSGTYTFQGPIVLENAAVKSLTLRAAAGERPCLLFYEGPNAPAAASLQVKAPMSLLELNGLLISGGPVRMDGAIERLRVVSCTLDPSNGPMLIAKDTDERDRGHCLVCCSIVGGVQLAAGFTRLTVADSIIDAQSNSAIQAADAQLERVTVLGTVNCESLSASECLLDGLANVTDRQSGGIRYTRYEKGSLLPGKYKSVPAQQQAAAAQTGRCLAPRFCSRRFGRSDYCQLALTCPPEILTASELRSEVGAFAGSLNGVRVSNLETKLAEFLPAGLAAAIIAET